MANENNMYPILIVLAIVVPAIAAYFIFRRKKQPDLMKRALAITNKTTTSQGVKVWIEDGAQPPSEAAIHLGLENCFEKARCKGYTAALSPSDYTIAVLKAAEERSSDGMPALAIPAGEYAGTIYDKGGYILIAGQMLQADYEDGNIIAIPEHSRAAAELTHLALIVDFEAEHIILAYNDGDEFERTKFHGGGISHPIIPPCSGYAFVRPGICCGPPRK